MSHGPGSGRQEAGGRRQEVRHSRRQEGQEREEERRRWAREMRAKTYVMKEETVGSGGEENLQEEGEGGGVEEGVPWKCQAALGGVK